ELAMRRLLHAVLSSQGYTVSEASNGLEVFDIILNRSAIDLLLLDLGLPDIEGLQIIRELRGSGSVLPIIVLSNRSDENAKITALDLGADDYVTKPFGAGELLARVRMAFRHRRQDAGQTAVCKIGDLIIDHVRRLVTLGGREIKLTPKEYALLTLMASNVGK